MVLRSIAASLALGAVVAIPLSATPTQAAVDPAEFPSCGDEAGPEFFPCVWDAKHEGDGDGPSYILKRNGDAIFVPHRYAHGLRH